MQVPADPGLAGGLDFGGLVNDLDLGGLLAGVDFQGLMGNLGTGLDLGAFAGLGALGEDEDDGEGAEDQVAEDQVADSVDDEPQA